MLSRGNVLQERYKVDQKLGSGGFGAVYLAYDQRLNNKKVAIKEALHKTDDKLRQFEREAYILADLQHDSLPRVTDYFNERNHYYLVMEYIEGESLGEYIVRQPDNFVKFDTTMQMMSPILDALEYMHTKTPPIIHRDIKPANIRLTPFGKVYLVDFGIAKAYNPDQPTTTAAQATSTGYSPPEQYYSADQQPQTDVRSDLYSLGSVDI
jgi:serine/threonine-protein kinase